jgi:hypothetical protein
MATTQGNSNNVRNPPQNGTVDLEDWKRNMIFKTIVYTSKAMRTCGKATAKSKRETRHKAARCLAWLKDVKYELTRAEETSRHQFDAELSNIRMMESVLGSKTKFQIEIDAVLREKFGVPKISNQEANNASMRSFLARYIAKHHPTMRRVDVVMHIEGAITRAYIPTPNENILADLRRSDAYRILNEAYHGEINMLGEIKTRTPTKWRRIWWKFVGAPPSRNLEKAEATLFKSHNVRYGTLTQLSDDHIDLPNEFGQVDPLYRPPEESTTQSDDGGEPNPCSGETSKGQGTGLDPPDDAMHRNNMPPAESVTTLESA